MPDLFLLFLMLILVGFGWLNVFSTLYNGTFDIHSSYGTQLIWIAASVLIGIFIYVIRARFFYNMSFYIYLIFNTLILVVLFFGVTRSGAKSWLGIGGFGIQPAEFAKYGTCLLLSFFVSKVNFDFKNIKYLAVAFGTILIPFVLMLLQNDTGTALPLLFLILPLIREGMNYWILIVGVAVIVLFVATMFIPQWVILAILSIPFIILIINRIKNKKRKIARLFFIYLAMAIYVLSVDVFYNVILRPHQRQRIDLLFGKIEDTRGIGYNVNQAKVAIGSGGWTGKGFGEGTQTHLNFVPEQSTDFIFCTIGEEYGFVGAVGLILIFILLFCRIIRKSEKSGNAFVRCYGYSIASIFFAHFTINVGMTIGLMPIIGIPLPFVSYGGSALWAFALMIFTFINIESKM
ncbi:MAG: rod shape-determining protein RodA [Bacteroidales bacterium]|nr:rod shape-determining protein RodA [Bacteroidales bacterium]